MEHCKTCNLYSICDPKTKYDGEQCKSAQSGFKGSLGKIIDRCSDCPGKPVCGLRRGITKEGIFGQCISFLDKLAEGGNPVDREPQEEGVEPEEQELVSGPSFIFHPWPTTRTYGWPYGWFYTTDTGSAPSFSVGGIVGSSTGEIVLPNVDYASRKLAYADLEPLERNVEFKIPPFHAVKDDLTKLLKLLGNENL